MRPEDERAWERANVSDYAKLKAVYQSVLKRETRKHQEHDEPLGMTARSFGHYLSTLAEGQTPDGRMLKDPIDALYGLTLDPSLPPGDRFSLVAGQQSAVEARLSSATTQGRSRPLDPLQSSTGRCRHARGREAARPSGLRCEPVGRHATGEWSR